MSQTAQTEPEPPLATGVGRRGRRRRWIGVLVALFALGTTALAVLLGGVLEAKRISFSGLHQVSLDEAEAAAAIGPGSFMPTLGVNSAVDALEELPWVAEAEVDRRWPSTVEVTVRERQAAALALSAPDTWVLCDIEGRVLSEALSVTPRLPRLSGITAAPAPGGYLGEDSQALLAVVDAAAHQRAYETQSVWRDNRGELRARVRRLSDSVIYEVILGDESALPTKTAAIAAIIGDLDALEAQLDLSVPHLPVRRTSTQP